MDKRAVAAVAVVLSFAAGLAMPRPAGRGRASESILVLIDDEDGLVAYREDKPDRVMFLSPGSDVLQETVEDWVPYRIVRADRHATFAEREARRRQLKRVLAEDRIGGIRAPED